MQIEIEIDGPRNQQLAFRPLQRTLRGRFDLNRIAEPQARLMTADWPQPIPGAVLALDPEKGEGHIVEPLYAPEHAATRERIEKAGMRLPPQRETFAGIDVMTWAYWMKRAVQAGFARLVSGKFPDNIDEAKVRKDFVMARQPDPRDGLINKLIGLLAATLPADKRKELGALLET